MVRRRRGGGGGGGASAGAGAGAIGADRVFDDTSYRDARTLQTAVVLDVFTLLADGPATAEDVAVRQGLDKRATELLLNALVEIGYVQKRNDRFSNAPHAQAYLVRGGKNYVGWSVLAEAQAWGLWGKLEDAVRTGKRPEGPRLFHEDNEQTRTLLRSLNVRAEALFTKHIVEKVKLDGVSTLLDLGGGAGAYTVAFCRRWPKMNATLFDLPPAIAVATETVGKTDVHKRVKLVAGDYRTDDLQGPYDAIFVSNVLHGENAANAKALLKKVFDALAPGGRLILRDTFMSADRARHGAVLSLNLLLTTDEGRCWSAPEAEAMLKETGFRDVRMTEDSVVVEAKRPGPPKPKEAPKEAKPAAAAAAAKPEPEKKPEPKPEPAPEKVEEAAKADEAAKGDEPAASGSAAPDETAAPEPAPRDEASGGEGDDIPAGSSSSGTS